MPIAISCSGSGEPCQKLDGGPGLAGRSRGSAVQTADGMAGQPARRAARHDRGARQWSGVSQRAREHLFEAFRSSARTGGTGLGLAIASELVRAHGGDIRLVAEAVRGAVFHISILDRVAELRPGRRGQREASRAIMLPAHRALVITAPSWRGSTPPSILLSTICMPWSPLSSSVIST